MPDNTHQQAAIRDSSPSLVEILEAVRPHVEKIEEGFTAIRVTLDALASHVGGRPSPPPVASSEPLPVAQPVRPVAESPPSVVPVSPRRVERPEPIAVASGDGGNWSGILFGENLHAEPSVAHLSGSLLADVYAGDCQAIALAGQVMTFRTGSAEQKARLLKDVGEAFYAWRPRGDDSLLQPLIAWVHAELDAVQLGNRIMVVQVGDRYDMQRHHAKQPGVEVADVYGWIVLRDNGKVFSKASVAVK